MEYLLGVDLGTSGVKTVLFDVEGRETASRSAEYPLYQPRNGWAEQDAQDWWRAVQTTIRGVLDASGVDPRAVRGVGLSGQMHGLVLLDGDGKPLRRAILWCDGRTQAECDEATQAVGAERLIEISANPALTGFTAGKLLWVRKNEPELFARARCALLPKDYVRYRLTGELAQEISDASGTNLLDVPHRRWSGEIMNRLALDAALLPPLVESSAEAGRVTRQAAQATGLAEGTPVAGGAGDNMAAALGTGVAQRGSAFTTIGTSGVVFAHSDAVRIDPKGRVHTFCAAVPGAYTNMSCTLAAGLSLKWYRDQFCAAERQAAAELGVDVYALMDREAAQSPIGANRLLFLPYLMGERSPLLDADARGAFIGLSAIHTRRDLLRAVMEGVMYAQRQNLDILRGMGVTPDHMLACGGGARSPFWRQMMADLFGLPVLTVQNAESPALGAAILAGVAAGVYPDVPAACAALVRTGDPVLPGRERSAAYEPYYRLYQSLYPALKQSYAALAAM